MSQPAVPSRPKALQGLPTPAAAPAPAAEVTDPAKKKQIHRKKVADEVLSTEASYCAALSALNDVAITTLSSILTPDEQKLLFSDISTILKFNQNFCANLDGRLKVWTDETGLGDIFLQFTPYLKMYTAYVANHEKAIQFEKELRDQPRFLRVQQQIFGNPRMSGSSSLANFLIMPIQRIPRYSLLLNELIKSTPEDHNDYPSLKTALEQVNAVAHRVNKEITEQQNRQLVYEKTLELGLDEARFVQPSRTFVKQGTMTKVCRSKDSVYEFFLFNDVLIYASRSTVGKYKVHQEIPIDGSFAIQDSKDEGNRKNQFKVINSIKSFAVYTETEADKTIWMNLLTTMIQQAKAKIRPTGDTGTIVPVWTPDDQANQCFTCKTGFSFFNRRHHCRFCGGVVCGDCSKRKAILRGKEERICDQCVSQKEQIQKSQQAFEAEDLPTPPPSSVQGGAKPPANANSESYIPIPLQYVAIQENVYSSEGDLSFKKGESILVYVRHPNGWWIGTSADSSDRVGIFQGELVQPQDPSKTTFVIEPVYGALVIMEPILPTEVQSTQNLLSYTKGDIVIVMLQQGTWCLAFNLKNKSFGFILAEAIVDLNDTNDDSFAGDAQEIPSQSLPSIPIPPTPSASAAPSTPLPKPNPPPPRQANQLGSPSLQRQNTAEKYDGPIPKGGCTQAGCKCEAFRHVAIRSTQCSDCGHHPTQHRA